MADYLLFEAPMGYSIFKVVHQADTVGNRLKEVQDSVQDLAKFGKMVELTSFLPFEYVPLSPAVCSTVRLQESGTTSRPSVRSTTSLRESHRRL